MPKTDDFEWQKLKEKRFQSVTHDVWDLPRELHEAAHIRRAGPEPKAKHGQAPRRFFGTPKNSSKSRVGDQDLKTRQNRCYARDFVFFSEIFARFLHT